MKYSVHSITTHDNGMKLYTISSPGFSTQVCSSQAHPIETLCGELNRLHHMAAKLEGELVVQIEAKCKALKRVEELEKRVFDSECENKALTQRLGVRTGQVSRLLDVLERCQGILAAYVQPEPRLKPKVALQDLLDILDDCALVTEMNNLRELIGVKDNGSVELTKEQKAQVLSALDVAAYYYPGIWPESLRTAYENACRILGASEDGDVAPVYSIKIAPGWVVGKDYVAGLGVGLQYCACTPGNPPFIVQGGRTFTNASKVLDGIKGVIGETELGAELQERVVNNTTNHFGPRGKDIRRIVLDMIRKEQRPGGLLHRD
ncbi:hypothetical protein [Pseudomonas phage PMBT14]|uniref:Uncharacterized protein n=1 Tax=Pseudomonas phage PMBT14 TaxID=2059855 RepID=A0A2I6PIC9_9CAUD|nr:hypothetical protein HWB42_gp69 [Pseudomonas phage PMBT14]AUM59787.1 hypothetical protein [Pseudomonas phage PMBT14]